MNKNNNCSPSHITVNKQTLCMNCFFKKVTNVFVDSFFELCVQFVLFVYALKAISALEKVSPHGKSVHS